MKNVKQKIRLFILLIGFLLLHQNAKAGCAAPATPTVFNLTVTAVTIPTAEVTLTWTAAGADQVFVQIDNTAGFGSPEVSGLTANDGSFAVTGFTCGSTYHFRIAGYETSNGGCLSGFSSITSYTVVCATCSDGILNQNETAIDCGGVCPPCGAPNCADGVQNQDETGIDCGGSCPTPCGAETCSDNILNQNETAIDCGGVCPACGSSCASYPSNSMNPAEGSTIDARAADQTITACTNISYNNSGNNWLHGVFVSSTSTGYVSSAATGAVPEANITVGNGGNATTYSWLNTTANFTGTNSGNSITNDGWFVETSDAGAVPGNNLGWPVAAGTNLGPFCFTTTVSCTGLSGNVAAFVHFGVTSDSYSGAWTNSNCGTETSSGGNSLSYTLQCPVSLPIDLLYFNGGNIGRANKLSWATANEKNNDYFTVYKSTNNGQSWTILSQVDSKFNGALNNNLEYEIYDENPAPEITYYKLRQTDFDGNIKESNVLGILTSAYFQGLSITPNPVNNLATITFRSSEIANTQVTIVDISGKKIHESLYLSENGLNAYTIEMKDLKSGIYFVELTNSFESQKIKFIKQ